jgi:hypothetical protein
MDAVMKAKIYAGLTDDPFTFLFRFNTENQVVARHSISSAPSP